MHSRTETIAPFLQHTLPIGALLLCWELVARTGLVNAYVFPPVSAIVIRLFDLFGNGAVYVPLESTVWRAIVGLCAAIVVGAPVGLLMGRARWAQWFFEPLFSFFFPLPKIALVPLYVQFFGLFSFSKVMLIFIDCLFPIVIFTYHGTRCKLDLPVVGAGARHWPRAHLLESRVAVVAGLALRRVQVAVVVAVLVAIVSEMVAGGSGLGYGPLTRTDRARRESS